MWKEFKEFAVKGILMPPLGLLIGDVDFSNIFTVLQEGDPAGPYASLELAEAAGAVTMNWGVFINTLISFLIVAFAVFMFVKWINNLKKETEAEVADAPADPKLTADQELLTEIRDLLKQPRAV